MDDLTQQIRDRLELPTLIVDVSKTKWAPEQVEEFRRHFDRASGRQNRLRILPIDADATISAEQMRAALLAVVEYATPSQPFRGERDSRDHAEKAIDEEVEATLARVLELVAEKLGIEVSDA